jgi:hypothetical protein
MFKTYRNLFGMIVLLLIITTLLTGCNFPTPIDRVLPNAQGDQIYQKTMITFKVTVEQPLPPGDSIYLSILDEVTGLAFNSHKNIMSADD